MHARATPRVLIVGLVVFFGWNTATMAGPDVELGIVHNVYFTLKDNSAQARDDLVAA